MPNFKPMLAQTVEPDKFRFPKIVQPKLDGVRASVVNGKLVSRNLKLIPNAEIQAALGRPEFEGLDGELIVGSPTAEDAFRTTTSYCMASNKTGGDWTFYVFDLWNHGGTFVERFGDLSDRRREPLLPPCCEIVAIGVAQDSDDLEAFERTLLEEGYEGAILRDPKSLYKFGRASKTKQELIKLKRFTDFEAEVVGVVEEMHNANEAKTNALGRTERSSHAAGKIGKGTLGKLRLRALNGPWKGVEFGCGTGFSATDRRDLWNEALRSENAAGERDLSGLNGRTAKVKAFEIGAKDAPRFPVWLGWRDERDMS